MAAGEDQPQAVVFEVFTLPFGLVVAVQLIGQQAQGCVETCPLAQPVDGLEATSRDQPGARIGRQTVTRPLLHRRDKGVMQGFLGQLEIAQQAD